MTTAVFQTVSRTAAAVALACFAAGAMAATVQPVTSTAAAVAIDTALLTANSITIAKVGSATLTGSTLSLPVASVSTATTGGAATVNFGDADGFILTTSFGTLTFKDFTFDAGTKTLSGDLVGGSTGLIAFLGINYQDSALLVATNVAGNVGTDPITAVTDSAAARDLYLSATQFTIAPTLAAYLGTKGLDASLIPVGQIIQSVNVGVAPAVPEPSTYALMGVGLVGIGLMTRKRRQA